jgi:hypothetical protein
MRKTYTCAVSGGIITIAAATVAAQLNTGPITQGRSVCVPYDPASLTLVQMQGTGDWQLRRGDGAIFKLFSDREDAEAGLAVAKQHTQLCYIGKGNTRPDRLKYIMEYWK